MRYDTILYELDHDIARVTLNRPEVMNGLNTAMRAELGDAVARAGREARCFVMPGSGRAFCSGQDLGDRVTAADLDLERTLREEYEPLLRAIYDCPVPTIAAVNGAAAGAGANLALAADVVIQVEDMPEEAALADMEIANPFELTGLYEGIPLPEKSLADPQTSPDVITLYRLPILAEWCERELPLGDLISHILVHELAHHFGWSDADIARIDRWWE